MFGECLQPYLRSQEKGRRESGRDMGITWLNWRRNNLFGRFAGLLTKKTWSITDKNCMEPRRAALGYNRHWLSGFSVNDYAISFPEGVCCLFLVMVHV